MRVGREVKRQVMAEELKRKPQQASTMSEEERKKMTDALMTLPKAKIVPALRSAGLDREADEVEQRFADEHLEELRRQKLEEINALPSDERLSALIANGFTDEARVLSEHFAAEKAEAEADKEEEAAPDEAVAIAPVTEKKKRAGRPRKEKK